MYSRVFVWCSICPSFSISLWRTQEKMIDSSLHVLEDNLRHVRWPFLINNYPTHYYRAGRLALVVLSMLGLCFGEVQGKDLWYKTTQCAVFFFFFLHITNNYSQEVQEELIHVGQYENMASMWLLFMDGSSWSETHIHTNFVVIFVWWKVSNAVSFMIYVKWQLWSTAVWRS